MPSSAGYLLFGSKTDGDVLKNLNIEFVSGLVPPVLAHVLIDCVVFAYTFNLLVNFVLKVSDYWMRLVVVMGECSQCFPRLVQTATPGPCPCTASHALPPPSIELGRSAHHWISGFVASTWFPLHTCLPATCASP